MSEPETTSRSQKPWWAAPATPVSAETPGVWQPKKQPPLNEAIELLRPIPVADPPVMHWQP